MRNRLLNAALVRQYEIHNKAIDIKFSYSYENTFTVGHIIYIREYYAYGLPIHRLNKTL